jgi:Pectate lyase superfamily protein
VAIVQISRITQRKGLESDLPQPLAGAELGWAIDQRRLFIGNGTIEDGAPVVGNTEVLTEFSDILSFATQYIYKGEAAGYTVQTGSTPGDPVAQSLQRRLDSVAVITAFGATGDGTTDVTADINRALFQIFCRSTNPTARRSIYFPAGTYVITDTLNIPPNCQLYGDGPDSTIISFNVQNWTSAVSWQAGTLVYNTATTLYYRSNFIVPVGTAISSTNPDGDPYWTAESLPDYMIQTADSLQQTGVNIGTNGAGLPGNVEISSMKFVSNQVHNGVLIEYADRCVFDSVTVQGPLTQIELVDAGDDVAAVRWSSSVSAVSRNVTWNNCKFSGFTYATDTDQQIQGVTFSNCDFDTLHQGIILGGAAPVNGGATGVRIVQNTFDNIHSQGIVIDGVSHNASAYNTFYDVANSFNGYAFPSASIIVIDAENNVSIGDMFGRSTSQSATYPRINLSDTTSISLGMNISGITFYQDNVQNNTFANQLMLGRYQRTAGIRDDIRDDSALGTLVIVDTDILKIPAFKMDYTIVRNGLYRTGTMTVVSAQDGTAGTGFAYSDDYTENGDTGVTLEAVHNLSAVTPLVTISYTATGAGDGTIRYSIAHIN